MRKKRMVADENNAMQECCGKNGEDCRAFQNGSELLGKRWTGVIVYTLLQKPHRFNELLSAVHGISDRLLTERLRELEENGLVERKVIPESPVKVEYALTAAGHETQEIVTAIWQWSNKWLVSESEISPSEQNPSQSGA